MSSWQKVFSHEELHKAELVKLVLENHHLSPVIVNRKDSSYNNFGFYEVHVSPDHVLRAIKIIKDDIDFKQV